MAFAVAVDPIRGLKGSQATGGCQASMPEKEHEHFIHYKLDDEPESTVAKFLTPTQILTDAGF